MAMNITIGKIIFPLTLILCVWLIFEIVEFFRLGGGGQPLALCIVKISVITSTIIGLSSERLEANSVNTVNYDNLLGIIQIFRIRITIFLINLYVIQK